MKKGFGGIILLMFLTAAFLFLSTGLCYADTSWDAEIVDQSDNTSYGSSIAVDADGNPHICYGKLISYSYTNPIYTVRYAYWSGSTWVVEDLLTGNLTTPKLVLDSSGNPRIMLIDRHNKEYIYGFKTDNSWTFETIYNFNIDALRSAHFFDLTLDSNDQPHLVLQFEEYEYDAETDAYVKYATKDSSGGWYLNNVASISKPPNTSNVLFGVSIVLDSGDKPHISYSYNNSIKYVFRQGDTWITETATTGAYPKIALDSSNVPHIITSSFKYTTKTSTGWGSNAIRSAGYNDMSTVRLWGLDPAGRLYCYYVSDFNHQRARYEKVNYIYNTDSGWTDETLLEWEKDYGMTLSHGMALDGSGNLHVTGEHNYKLYYTAQRPDIEAEPISVNFNNTSPEAYDEKEVTITNTGSGNLSVSDINCSNPIESNFIIGEGLIINEIEVFTITSENISNRVLAPGESGTVTVRFSPEALETYSGSLTIHSNDRDEGVISIDLAGSGVEPPEIEISPLSLNFGSVSLGSSMDEHITISNPGSGSLDLGDVVITGEAFSLVEDISDTSVEPESSTTLTVRFAPEREQTYSGSLTISSNDSDENPVTVNLDGSGVPITGQIYISPGSQSFGDVYVDSSADAEFTVSNTGNGDLNINSITVTGAEFNLITDSISSSTLPPGGSASYRVRFIPGSTGTFSGSVIIASDDPETPDTVIALTGRGIAVQSAQQSIVQGPNLNFVTTVQINAADPSGAPVSLSLGSDAPDFVTLNGTRLIFSADAPAGTYTFTVNAHGSGGTASRKLTVTSFGRNSSPVIKPIPDQRMPVGSTVTLDIDASDPDGDQVILGLSGDAPGFATVKGSQLIMSPREGDSGRYSFLLLGSDGRGGLGAERVEVRVSGGAK